ncbi:MIP/aquaporin family protein [Micromonospora sp. DT4]
MTGKLHHHTTLHGHPIGTATGRATAAEFIGTFVLVLTIIATATQAALNTPIAGAAYSSETVAFAGAAAIVIMAVTLGGVSGAHLNPAVTVALALTRRFPWSQVPSYVVAQLAGALLAAVTAWAVEGEQARSAAGLGATTPAPGVSGIRVLLVEALVTFLLVLVVVAVAADSRLSRLAGGVAIGTALAAAILISGPITGAGVNPARALGPMIVAGNLTDWWAYLIGPLVGGAAAAGLYRGLASAAPTTKESTTITSAQ